MGCFINVLCFTNVWCLLNVSCDVRLRHASHECVMRRMPASCLERVTWDTKFTSHDTSDTKITSHDTSHVYQSCHTWIRYDTHECVMSRRNGAFRTWMSHVTRWGMSYLNESWHVWMKSAVSERYVKRKRVKWKKSRVKCSAVKCNVECVVWGVS